MTKTSVPSRLTHGKPVKPGNVAHAGTTHASRAILSAISTAYQAVMHVPQARLADTTAVKARANEAKPTNGNNNDRDM